MQLYSRLLAWIHLSLKAVTLSQTSSIYTLYASPALIYIYCTAVEETASWKHRQFTISIMPPASQNAPGFALHLAQRHSL